MFLTWAPRLVYGIPFSTEIFRKTQKKMEAFLLRCINAEIENCEKKEYKTLLLFMKNAKDPRTGKTLSTDDLINNGVLLLYPPLFRC